MDAECEAKRRACEENASRWLLCCTMCDEQLRVILSFIRYHKSRGRPMTWLDELEIKIQNVLQQMN